MIALVNILCSWCLVKCTPLFKKNQHENLTQRCIYNNGHSQAPKLPQQLSYGGNGIQHWPKPTSSHFQSHMSQYINRKSVLFVACIWFAWLIFTCMFICIHATMHARTHTHTHTHTHKHVHTHTHTHRVFHTHMVFNFSVIRIITGLSLVHYVQFQ